MRKNSVAGARFVRASDQALLVSFDQRAAGPASDRPPEEKLPLEANRSVRRLLQLLTLRPIAGIRNLHPAYGSLLVNFDGQRWQHRELEKKLRARLEQLQEVRLPKPRRVEIPVCYGEEFGPDLDDVARMLGLTAEQVIELHTSRTYLVYFLGFVPGFAYLGELPESLVTPRHATPRRTVPAGSVGIAGCQTGVYPCKTPGGWRLLGRTPLAMFRPERRGLSLLSIGDCVRFKAISRQQFPSENA
jgi:inhibitor of KinA